MTKRIIIIVIAFFIGIVVLGVAIFFQEEDSINDLRFIVENNNKSETVRLYHTEERYYAFLPSFADFNKMRIDFPASNRIFINGMPLDENFDCMLLKENSEYDLCVKNSLGITVCNEKMVIKKSANIPAAFVSLVDGRLSDINKDKNTEKTGSLSIINSDGMKDFSGSFKSFSGRGNGTWGQVKKPYTLEFKDDTELLRMGKGKKYAFLADALDYSHMRNKLAYDAAKAFDLPCAVDSCYVDLYVDSEYLGLYLLSESIEVGKERVDIADLADETSIINQFSLSSYSKFHTPSYVFGEEYISGYELPNNPSDISGGYLLEYQFGGRAFLQDSFFKTKSDLHFSLKSPKYASKEQLEYISEYYQTVEKSFSTDQFEKYIDIDSWVKFYLIQECFGNTDLGSEFFYKNINDGKLYAGPIWDFDISMGNNSNCYHNTEGTLNVCKDIHSGKSVIHPLYENEKFKQMIVEGYKTLARPYLEKIRTELLKEQSKMILSSFNMDKLRWKDIQTTNRYHDFLSMESNVDYLSEWINARIEFLDDTWLGNQPYYTVLLENGLETTERERFYYSVKPNETLSDIPVLEVEGYQFIGWYDNKTNERLEWDTVIDSDKFFLARWEKTDHSMTAGILQKFTSKLMLVQEYIPIAIISVIILVFIVSDMFVWFRCKRRRKNG